MEFILPGDGPEGNNHFDKYIQTCTDDYHMPHGLWSPNFVVKILHRLLWKKNLYKAVK